MARSNERVMSSLGQEGVLAMKRAVLLVSAVTILLVILGLAFPGFVGAQNSPRTPGMNVEFDFKEDDQVKAETARQDNNDAARQDKAAGGEIVLIVLTLVGLAVMAVMAVMIASLWVIFGKAGKPGWAAIIPIYNAIVLLEICGRPIWWIALLLIPCVNVVVAVIVWIDLAKSFGKDVLFGIGLWLLGFVFLPILAFGSAQYRGPSAAT